MWTGVTATIPANTPGTSVLSIAVSPFGSNFSSNGPPLTILLIDTNRPPPRPTLTITSQ
jgi:hypothetical protein